MNATWIPEVVFRLALSYLSLIENKLTEVPAKLFYTPFLMVLDLRANPLTSLPEVPASMIEEHGPPGATIQTIEVSSTGFQQLPSWFGTRPIRLVALNTPFCQKLKEGDPSVVLNELTKPLVVC